MVPPIHNMLPLQKLCPPAPVWSRTNKGVVMGVAEHFLDPNY